MSGVPGTGKTATVRQVVAELRERVREGDLPNFTFVEINSLRLASPKHVYTHLHEVRVSMGTAPMAGNFRGGLFLLVQHSSCGCQTCLAGEVQARGRMYKSWGAVHGVKALQAFSHTS